MLLQGGFISAACPLHAAAESTHKLSPALIMLEVLEDKSGFLDIDDVLSPAAESEFKLEKTNIPNKGFSSSAFWARFRLENVPDDNYSLIVITFPLLDSVEYYRPVVSGTARPEYVRTAAGRDYPFKSREYNYRAFAFNLGKDTPHDAYHYLRIESEDAVIFPVSLMDGYQFADLRVTENFIFGIYYGILLVMLLYNAFLYLSLRDRNYLNYVLFLCAYGLFLMSMNGISTQYLWPDSGLWIKTANPALISLSIFFAVRFTTGFIKTAENTPGIHAMLILISVISLFSFVLSFFIPYRIAIIAGQILPLCAIFSVIPAAAISWRNGFRPARFYLLAWSMLLLGVILSALRVLGIIGHNVVTEYGLQIGSGIELVLLSLALADRINILNREKAEAQAEAIENLQKADRLKDAFFANTSHELRTPLSGIIGLAESLLEGSGGELSAGAARNLSLIASSGRRLASLVNDILDYSRLKHRDIVLNNRPVDLFSLADVVIELTAPLASQSSLKVENRLPENFAAVWGDEERICQVLINLVGNAIKFSDSGTVAITAEYGEGDGSGMAVVSVSDSGIGIPESMFEDIFQPYEQVDDPNVIRFGGTGIGLAITKKLVELHGGSINVKSSLGVGSTFYFTLPLSGEKAPRAETLKQRPVIAQAYAEEIIEEFGIVESESNNPSSRTEILAVDDDPVNLQLLSDILGLAGFHVRKCVNGKAAIDLIDSGYRPAIVLMDLMMPGMSGYEATRRIREKYKLTEMPVMLITAKGQSSDIVAGLEAGANEYIMKPFDSRILMARVSTLLSLRNSDSEIRRLVSIDQELAIARRIQQSTIPKTLPVVKGIKTAARYVPIEGIGGDFYDIHELEDGSIAVLLTDVSGHGLPSALVASMVKMVFCMQKVIASRPSEFLERMNDILIDNIENSFLTASYIYLNSDRNRMVCSNAGHVPLLLLREGSEEIVSIKPSGRLIGWSKGLAVKEEEIEVRSGDRIVMYTDGIIECFSQDKVLYDTWRFNDFILRNRRLGCDDFVDELIYELQGWAGGNNSFEDDLTIVVIDIE